MKTRAGIEDDTSGRATSLPSLPTCWWRDRSSPRRGVPPLPRRARGPKRAAADKPRGLSGAATEGSGAHSRGTRRAPCQPPPSLIAAVGPARRVTGATPSGRPGPRAPTTHTATSRRGPDSVNDRWACGACVRRGHRTARRPAHRLNRSRRGAGLARRVPPAWPFLHAT